MTVAKWRALESDHIGGYFGEPVERDILRAVSGVFLRALFFRIILTEVEEYPKSCQ
jgi:hypothetical protein